MIEFFKWDLMKEDKCEYFAEYLIFKEGKAIVIRFNGEISTVDWRLEIVTNNPRWIKIEQTNELKAMLL